MKKTRILILAMIALFAFEAAAFAAPANPTPSTVTQPWGEKIVVCEHGDEFFNWTATEKGGYPVIRDNGIWYYATEQNGKIVSTGVAYRANSAVPAGCKANYTPSETVQDNIRKRRQKRSYTLSQSSSRKKSLSASANSSTEVTGERNMVVIRVEFNDSDLLDEDYKDTFFKTGEGVRSVAQYYIDQSGGKLNIKAVEGGLLKVKLDQDHPGQDLNWKVIGDEKAHKNEVALFTKVLEQSKIDLSKYDTNNDKILTNDELAIYMILAGYEGDPTKECPNSVYAHAEDDSFTDKTKYGEEHRVTVNGITVQNWAMNGEKDQKTKKLYQMLGVVCHELGHQLLLLPDLYDTSYYNSGLGNFSLMSFGCKGTDGGNPCPVDLDAWSKIRVGWVEAKEVEASSTAQKLTFKKDNIIKIIAPSGKLKSQQYLLAQLIDPTSGWNKGLTGLFNKVGKPGIIVTLVDGERQDFIKKNGVPSVWDINNTGIKENEVKLNIHQGVMPICADNSLKYGEKCDNALANETLWYAENKMELTPDTTPNTNFYSDLKAMKPEVKSYISLTNISNSDADEMTATLKESSDSSGSSSGGCNAGFGALMLLFVIALPAAKKYGKKAA